MVRHHVFAPVTVLAACLLLSNGCSSEQGRKNEQPPAQNIRYELHPWTYELKKDTLAALESFDPETGEIRFKGVPAQLAQLKKSEILLAGQSPTTPAGVLRLVTEVKVEGGNLVVATLPSPIQLAFKSLHAKLQGTATLLDGTAPSGQTQSIQATHVVSKSIGGGRSIEWAAFDHDKNRNTKDDQLYVEADLQAKLTLSASIDLDWLEDVGKAAEEVACAAAFPACIPELPDVKMGAKVEAVADASVNVEGAAAKDIGSGEIDLGEPIEINPPLTAGPLVVTSTIDFVGAVEGSATSRFRTNAGMHYSAETGISIGLKSPPKFIPPDPTSQFDPPTVEATLTSQVKAGVGPRVTFLFWDTVGPKISLLPYGRVRADTAKSPCWSVDAGVDVRAGISLRVPWKLFAAQELADLFGLGGEIFGVTFGPWSLFEKNDLLSGSCSPIPQGTYPPGEGPTPEVFKSPTFTPWSKRFVGWQATFPYSGELAEMVLHVDRSVDTGWFVTGRGIPGVLKVSEQGSIDWAKLLHLPAVEDEEVALDEARSAVAKQALDMNVWVATSRFTLMKLDQDGDLVFAKRYRPADQSLAHSIGPVGLLPTSDGGALVLYALQEIPEDGPAVLLRVDATGKLLWSRTFKYETEKTFVPVMVADGDETVIAGYSWVAGAQKAHLARLRADGTVVFARTLDVCGNERVRPSAGVRLASGTIAIVGAYSMGPERSFLAQIAPDGSSASVAAWWSGDFLKDLGSNAGVQLPVSGFLTLGHGDPIGPQSLYLASHDAQGAITWQHELEMVDASGAGQFRPGAVRLTNDGGALVFAHVANASQTQNGIWISKLPAITGKGAFDPNLVQVTTPSSPPSPCAITLGPDTLTLTDIELKTVDVTKTIVLDTLAPQEQKLIP